MSKRSWIRRLFARPVTGSARQATTRFRPSVILLEDRCVPAPIVVDNPTDTHVNGQTDLREAIFQAGTTPGADTITFRVSAFNNFTTKQTITLGGTQLDLSNSGPGNAVTIQGPGANLLAISGNSASRVFYLKSGTATLSGLTVTGGKFANGGGLFNAGTATLTNCTVGGNSTNTAGGGLYNAGSATLTNCTVSGNSATTKGGGLYNAGSATLTNCTVSGDSASLGGGLFNSGGMATLTNCTISGNSATTRGGGLYNGGPTTLTNCTISGNSATTTGGGLYNARTATLDNTIVAGNTNSSTNPGTPSDIAVATNHNVTGQHNLIGTGGGGGLTDGTGGNIVLTSLARLELAPLGDNGGPTQTMPLLPGSAAIGGVPANTTGTPSTDQRGLPRTTKAATDIGAFQSGLPLVVNTTADVGATATLTLRQAIALANVLPGDNTITFDPKVFNKAQTITLSGTQLDLSNSGPGNAVTIQGPGANLLAINGNKASRVFYLLAGTATLSGLTVTGGKITGLVSLSASGGGLYNKSGTATLTNCTVSGNSAGVGGGGLLNNSGTATLTNCTVSGNSAGLDGGGLFNISGTATLTNCTVSGNSSDVSGGGLYNNSGTDTLTNCTVSGNSTGIGGGLVNNSGTATLTNCTVSGNSATSKGGGLYNVVGATLDNTIVAGNTNSSTNPGTPSDIAVANNKHVTGQHNLIGTGGAGGLTNGTGGNIVLTSLAKLRLAPLGNYGGPTQTMPPLPGSAALDAGNNALAVDAANKPLTTDQRGQTRIVGRTVDIGAVESQAAAVVVSGPTSRTVKAGTRVTFTAAASGIPTPTVRWQVSLNGGKTFKNLTATATTLTFKATAALNGAKFRAIFTNTIGTTKNTATTKAATLSVDFAPLITTQPQSQQVVAGKKATFKIAEHANPAKVLVQWQVSKDGGKHFINLTHATSTSFSITTAKGMNGQLFRAVVKNSIGTTTSKAARLTV